MISILAAAALLAPVQSYKTVSETKEKSGYYTASATYPKFTAPASLATPANKEIARLVKQYMGEFVSQAADYFKDNPAKPTAPWEHETSCTTTLANLTVLSVLMDHYEFAGGAHPNSWTSTVNVALVGGKATHVRLANLLAKGKDKKAFLNEVVLPVAAKARKERTGEDTTVFPMEFADHFNLSRNTLTYTFDKYVLGPYVEGDYQVKLKWQDIKAWIDPKLLAQITK